MKRALGINNKRTYAKIIVPESSESDSSVDEPQTSQIFGQNSPRLILESECSQTPLSKKRCLSDDDNINLSDIDMFNDDCINRLITSTSSLLIDTPLSPNEPRPSTSR